MDRSPRIFTIWAPDLLLDNLAVIPRAAREIHKDNPD
jgi:hypothetical protein